MTTGSVFGVVPRLVLDGLRHGKARFACAALGMAAAAGAVVFMFSLAATNDAQAPALAASASRPWAAWRIEGWTGGMRRGSRGDVEEREKPPVPITASPDLRMKVVGLSLDIRPGGKVLQGPPMTSVMAKAPEESPYESAPLAEGRWVDEASSEAEFVCTANTLKRFGRDMGVNIGDQVKFVGARGTLSARLVGLLAEAKLPRGFPDSFANAAAFEKLSGERRGTISMWRRPVEGDRVLAPSSDTVVAMFKSDEQRRMDYARPLMLIAAVLTALALLVNSLLLSVEANRPQLAVLRTIGLSRLGVVRFVMLESLTSAACGLGLGAFGSAVALKVYVACDRAAFPVGAAFDWRAVAVTAVVALAVAVLAVLFALGPALSVRPMDAASTRPSSRRRGMAVAFAFGFASFVAVEVWGASLMRGFVPSPEWPDAIISLLPSGASSFDVEKLRRLDGVRRISELYPLQLMFPQEDGIRASAGARASRYAPNALFLAAEWLPGFRFVEGSHDECTRALAENGACVISLMIANAHNLHKGDELAVMCGGGRGSPATETRLPIAGVVDVNWHMVTSRGLVRGMNGAPVMTDGPVFVSLDTIESLDARPSSMVRMTHLWVEYEPAFLAKHGAFQAGRLVEESVRRALGDPSDITVRLHARDEIAEGTMAHGTDLIGQAARVPFVFLAFLSIGFVAMLVAEADACRREHAVLRAIGATKGQIAARLAASALRTALAGIAIGLPAGAFFGWVAAGRTAAVWSGMPHYFAVPWRIVTEGSAGALVLALAVALPVSLYIVSCEFSSKAQNANRS